MGRGIRWRTVREGGRVGSGLHDTDAISRHVEVGEASRRERTRDDHTSNEAERLFRCDPERYERFIAFVDPAAGKFLMNSESPDDPPNVHLVTLRDEVEAAADQYSAALIIYELLAGCLPFTSSTSLGWLSQHKDTPPAPLTSHRPDCPPELAAAIMRALSKQPAERFDSVAELREVALRYSEPA